MDPSLNYLKCIDTLCKCVDTLPHLNGQDTTSDRFLSGILTVRILLFFLIDCCANVNTRGLLYYLAIFVGGWMVSWFPKRKGKDTFIYKLWRKSANIPVQDGLVDGGRRIHWLNLCRGVPPPQWVSWIWHKFGECRVLIHCHHSQVHSSLMWLHLKESYLLKST